VLELALDLGQLDFADLDDRALEAFARPGKVIDDQRAKEDDVGDQRPRVARSRPQEEDRDQGDPQAGDAGYWLGETAKLPDGVIAPFLLAKEAEEDRHAVCPSTGQWC